MVEYRVDGVVAQTQPLLIHGDISAKGKGAKDHPLSGSAPQAWQAGDHVTIVLDVQRTIVRVEHPKGTWQRTPPRVARTPQGGHAPGGHGGRDRQRNGHGEQADNNRHQRRVAPRGATPHGRPGNATFLNPYALVPAPPRTGDAEEWGDHAGLGHDVLRSDLWSGTIPVTITTQSPLLLLDQGAADPTTGVPIRERGGRPILEWTAVKGMLRSYFEAVTNSRFSVVDSRHSDYVAMRQPASEALTMRVGYVTTLEADGSGKVVVNTEFAPQTYPDVPRAANPSNNPDLAPLEPMNPGVWVPRDRIAETGMIHGQEVEAWIHLLIHKAKEGKAKKDQPNKRGRGQRAFWYWQATDVAAPDHLPPRPSNRDPGGTSIQPESTVAVKVKGKLLIGGHSFRQKHDERLFVTKVFGPSPVTFAPDVVLPFTTEDSKRWHAIYDSYHQARNGNTLPNPQWGRHNTSHAAEKDLQKGQLLFVRVEENAGHRKLTGLFPVMIGRETFPSAPHDLLDDGHRPAATLAELSPADRLFGWARAEAGTGDRERSVDAYAGHVRCDDITCERDDAIERGTHPLWLSPLSSPKPEQFRFRLLSEKDEPIRKGAAKAPASGYSPDKRLGRAMYWPHKGLPEGYWAWPGKPDHETPKEVGYNRQPAGTGEQQRYREYLAPKNRKLNQRTNQQETVAIKKDVTKAIAGWVKPGTTFTATLRLDNVEPALLGALLWLLHHDEDFTLMLGGGKPLGFGAVRMQADLGSARLATGTSWRSSYRTWAGQPSYASEEELLTLITKADEALPRRCRDAVLAMGRGVPALPVHTPRLDQVPQAESYEWFVANERPRGRKWSNPAPDAPEPGLPYDPSA